MAKTNPIGVRFNEELLNKLKEASLADSPQKALNLYERSYVELIQMKVGENNKPENKGKILKERQEGLPIIISAPTKSPYDAERVYPLISDEMGQWETPIPEPEIEKATQQSSIDHKAKIAELKSEMEKLGTDWIGNRRRKEIKSEIAKLESEK